MTNQDENTGLQVAEHKDEPNWVLIGWKYADLHKATHKLAEDLKRYADALNELDGAGTAISNGKERIFALREEIYELGK